MPTFSDYTRNLKKDKNKLRKYLASASLSTQISDSFVDLSQTTTNNSGVGLTIFTQMDEPAQKHGLWFKTNDVNKVNKVASSSPFKIEETWSTDSSLGSINTNMPLYRIIHKGYMYGFTSTKCVRVDLNNPSVLETLPTPREQFGTSMNIVSNNYNYSAITSLEDDIYVLCASAEHGNSTVASKYNDIFKYNVNTKTWTYVNCVETTNATSKTAQPTSMIGVNGKVYLFGSMERQSYGVPDQASYWILDPNTKIIDGPYSSPQNRVGAGAPAVYEDRFIYLWCTGYQDGGNSTFYSRPQNNVYRLDTEDNTWESLRAAPVQHCGMNVEPLVIGNKIYLFSVIEDGRYWGNLYSQGSTLSYVYDILSDTYTRLPNLPVALQGKVLSYYNEEKNCITISGRTNYSGSVVQSTVNLLLTPEEHEEGEVIFDLGLMTEDINQVNLYHYDNINTRKFNTKFKKAVMWDKATNKPKDIEAYIGDGEKWTKI